MMIQDIGPHVFHNEFKVCTPAADSRLMSFLGDKVLLKKSPEQETPGRAYPLSEAAFPTWAEYLASLRSAADRHDVQAPEELSEQPQKDTAPGTPAAGFLYLFAIDETAYFLARPDTTLSIPGFAFEPVRNFRTTAPQETSFAMMSAWHLFQWYRDTRFCGRCGSPLVADTKQRMMRCPDCGNMIYPRINPCVIIGIMDGSRLLMSRYAGRSYKNYALIAGFAEFGEAMEDTVRREVMEEVGLKVKNITYYKSQPWGMSSSLLCGYFCELDGPDQITLEEDELAEAGWYERDDIDLLPDEMTLTREMILEFKNRK